MKIRKLLFITIIVLMLSCHLPVSFTVAEIVTDGTVGPALTLSGPNYRVTPDLGIQSGHNLFHSFNLFNIGKDESAIFSGSALIEHVISRVTGGNISTIDGALVCNIPGADIFLINPAGIIFGPNASILISGSFYAGTADFIRFSDDTCFRASTPQHSSFSSAPPAAFGFIDNTPGNIRILGTLSAADGNNLNIAGGDIELKGGKLEANEGTLKLTAAASNGDVGINTDVSSFERMGNITLSDNSAIVSRGEVKTGISIRSGHLVVNNSTIGIANYGNAAVGKIDIGITENLEVRNSGAILTLQKGEGMGNELQISAENIKLMDGGTIYTYSDTAGMAGNLNIKAEDSITVTGKTETGNPSSLMSLSDGAGGTGDLNIQTSSLSVESGGRIVNHHNLDGYRGLTSINADSIFINGNSNIMCADLGIKTGTLEISNGALIWGRPSLFGPYDSPLLSIDASEYIKITGQGQEIFPWRNRTNPLYTGIHTDSFVYPRGVVGSMEIRSPLIFVTESGQISTRTNTGDPAGNISINAGRIVLKEGGQISADSNGSSAFYGPAGNISVNATESIEISGNHEEIHSGFFSTTRSNGNAGKLEITSPILTIEDGGRIMVATGVFGEGDAGKIILKTDRLKILSGGGISGFSAGYGDEGEIEIFSNENVFIDDGFIESNGDREGAAGDIYLVTGTLSLINGSISASVRENGWRTGGNIIINVDRMTLESDSHISAFSMGFGNAGNILLETNNVLLSDSSITTETVYSDGGEIIFGNKGLMDLRNSKITTMVAGGIGNGGNIDIRQPTFLVLEQSQIIANAFEGAGGNIQIDTLQLIQDSLSEIDASSKKGINGRIDISSPETDISGGLLSLPAAFLDITALINNACEINKTGMVSSLVSTGFLGNQGDPEDVLLSGFYKFNSLNLEK